MPFCFPRLNHTEPNAVTSGKEVVTYLILYPAAPPRMRGAFGKLLSYYRTLIR